jgi:hypothetical protein
MALRGRRLRARGGPPIDGSGSRYGSLVEAGLWLTVLALLSPLLLYYRAGTMPLAALFGIAAGIAVGLALAGRRLHGSLLADALSGRESRGRFLMTVGMALLLLFFVLVGAAVALAFLLRGLAPRLPV